MAGNFLPTGYFDVTRHLTMKLFPAKISERVTLQSLWRQRVTVVVYHWQKFPGNPVGKYMEHDLLGLPNGKYPGATEHLKRYSCLSRWNTPNRSSCSISSKPSLVSVSRLCGRFPVKGTDLCSGKRDSSSGTRFTSPELCEPFTQTVNRPVYQCKW